MEVTDIHILYEYFSGEFSGDRSFKISLSKNQSMISSFIRALGRFYDGTTSLGTVFLWNYFTFQYNYWLDKQTYCSIPEIHHILGDKARERWFQVIKAKDIPYLYFIKINLLKRYPTLQFNYIEKLFVNNIVKVDNIVYEEEQRQLFFNTARGFHNCYYHTTLYSEKSKFCCKCKNKLLCSKIKLDIL